MHRRLVQKMEQGKRGVALAQALQQASCVRCATLCHAMPSYAMPCHAMPSHGPTASISPPEAGVARWPCISSGASQRCSGVFKMQPSIAGSSSGGGGPAGAAARSSSSRRGRPPAIPCPALVRP